MSSSASGPGPSAANSPSSAPRWCGRQCGCLEPARRLPYPDGYSAAENHAARDSRPCPRAFVKVPKAPPGSSRLSAPREGRVHNEPSAEPPGFTVTVTQATVTVVLSGEFDLTSEDFLASRLAHVLRESPRR